MTSFRGNALASQLSRSIVTQGAQRGWMTYEMIPSAGAAPFAEVKRHLRIASRTAESTSPEPDDRSSFTPPITPSSSSVNLTVTDSLRPWALTDRGGTGSILKTSVRPFPESAVPQRTL